MRQQFGGKAPSTWSAELERAGGRVGHRRPATSAGRVRQRRGGGGCRPRGWWSLRGRAGWLSPSRVKLAGERGMCVSGLVGRCRPRRRVDRARGCLRQRVVGSLPSRTACGACGGGRDGWSSPFTGVCALAGWRGVALPHLALDLERESLRQRAGGWSSSRRSRTR